LWAQILKAITNDVHTKLLSPSNTVEEVWRVLLNMPSDYHCLCTCLRSELPDHVPVVESNMEKLHCVGVTRAMYLLVFGEEATGSAWWGDAGSTGSLTTAPGEGTEEGTEEGPEEYLEEGAEEEPKERPGAVGSRRWAGSRLFAGERRALKPTSTCQDAPKPPLLTPRAAHKREPMSIRLAVRRL